jgi:hypothetical protein
MSSNRSNGKVDCSEYSHKNVMPPNDPKLSHGAETRDPQTQPETPVNTEPAVDSSAVLGVSVGLSRDNKTITLSVQNGYVEMNQEQLMALNYACAKTLLLMTSPYTKQ